VSPERRALRAVIAYVEDEVRPRDASTVLSVTAPDDDGIVHLRGGYWASTAERAVYCYTLENAKAVQKIIARSLGWKDRQRGIDTFCTIDAAEGIIQQALAEPEYMRKDRSKKRMRRRRKACVADGICIMCTRDPAREGRKTCAPCSKAAQERVEKARYLAAAALDDQKKAS
jgi:hypothetical protein